MVELGFELNFAADLVTSDVIDRLQATLAALDTPFRHDMRVQGHENDRNVLQVEPDQHGALRAAIVKRGLARSGTYRELEASLPPSPYRRRFGFVEVRSKTPSTSVHVSFDEYVPAMPISGKWLFSNSIDGWTSKDEVGNLPRQDFVRRLCGALASAPSFLWGAARLGSEFEARNRPNEGTGGSGVLGRDMSRALPGVYWMNYFGGPYVDLIGRDVLAGCSADVAVRDTHIEVRAYPRPEDWSTDRGRQQHATLVAELGQHHFFDRSDPDRPTVAPAFGLPELADSRPHLDVITSDGINFTPLPEDPSV